MSSLLSRGKPALVRAGGSHPPPWPAREGEHRVLYSLRMGSTLSDAIGLKSLPWVGLVLGAVMGFAFLVAGTATLIPGLFVWIWLAVQRPRWLGVAGGLIGLGGSLLILLGRASWSCANDVSCYQPDPFPWLAITGLLVASGAIIGLGAWQHRPSA